MTHVQEIYVVPGCFRTWTQWLWGKAFASNVTLVFCPFPVVPGRSWTGTQWLWGKAFAVMLLCFFASSLSSPGASGRGPSGFGVLFSGQLSLILHLTLFQNIVVNSVLLHLFFVVFFVRIDYNITGGDDICTVTQ